MEQKKRIVALAQSGHFTIGELCEQFGIACKSGHKWLTRYAECGAAGIKNRSRAPRCRVSTSILNRVDAKVGGRLLRTISR